MDISCIDYCSHCGDDKHKTVRIATVAIGTDNTEVWVCNKCLIEASKSIATNEKSGNLWKLLGEEGSSVTYGMNIPQGVIVRVDQMDPLKKKCITSSMTVIQFSTIVPKDQNLYHIISTIDGDMTRISKVMIDTFDRNMRKKGL